MIERFLTSYLQQMAEKVWAITENLDEERCY